MDDQRDEIKQAHDDYSREVRDSMPPPGWENRDRLMDAAPEMDQALSDAWKALSWAINYDSEDKILARCIKKIESARERAGTFDYRAMREKIERDRPRRDCLAAEIPGGSCQFPNCDC